MSSETNTYRFILTPLNRVFFGGEKSPFKEEYYRHSQFMPQQTAVLGLLRYEMLRRHGVLTDRSGWDELIGKHSFDPQAEGQTFGHIRRISPVSVYDCAGGRDYYLMRDSSGFEGLPVPGVRYNRGNHETLENGFRCFGKKTEKNKYEYYDIKGDSTFGEIFTDFGGISRKVEYKPKKTDCGRMLSDTGNGIFYRDTAIGITKNYLGMAADDAYFKTDYWRMVSGFAYSFFAELDETEEFLLKEGVAIVHLGGNSCLYRMDVIAVQEFPCFEGEGDAIVLLSDCCVKAAGEDGCIYDYCTTVVSDTLLFRNLKTSTGSKCYHRRPVMEDVNRAKVLLKKGSILIPKAGKKEKVLEMLDCPEFKKIGYNYYRWTKILQTNEKILTR